MLARLGTPEHALGAAKQGASCRQGVEAKAVGKRRGTRDERDALVCFGEVRIERDDRAVDR